MYLRSLKCILCVCAQLQLPFRGMHDVAALRCDRLMLATAKALDTGVVYVPLLTPA